MCGILGITPSADQDLFLSALNRLDHRGPDDWGVYHEQGQISLGQRRLSILDLTSEGRQPMVSASQRYNIIFNGELYNFIELRDELGKKGYRFKSESDTEVLLAAFEEWGEDFLHKLNGMWAFAVWDTVKKQLFLSRDRFGKKPLFYAILGNGIVFASEMKAVIPFLPEVKPSEDFSWMASHILLVHLSILWRDSCVH